MSFGLWPTDRPVTTTHLTKFFLCLAILVICWYAYNYQCVLGRHLVGFVLSFCLTVYTVTKLPNVADLHVPSKANLHRLQNEIRAWPTYLPNMAEIQAELRTSLPNWVGNCIPGNFSTNRPLTHRYPSINGIDIEKSREPNIGCTLQAPQSIRISLYMMLHSTRQEHLPFHFLEITLLLWNHAIF